MAKNNIPIKIIVAVGDSQSGKSTLLFKFAKDQFIEVNVLFIDCSRNIYLYFVVLESKILTLLHCVF